jgi:hypothetical protein
MRRTILGPSLVPLSFKFKVESCGSPDSASSVYICPTTVRAALVKDSLTSIEPHRTAAPISQLRYPNDRLCHPTAPFTPVAIVRPRSRDCVQFMALRLPSEPRFHQTRNNSR